MMRRPRATTAKAVMYSENKNMDSDLSFSQIASSDEDMEEWRPPESKKAASKTARPPTAGGMKAASKRTAKPKAPKEPKVLKVPKDPKPRAPRKRAAEQKSLNTQRTEDTAKSVSAGTKRKKTNDDDLGDNKRNTQTDCPEEQRVDTGIRMKQEVIIMARQNKHE
ncbi:hypothetical protein AMECASPLE_032147 [Ameca splendens]|uniref:Uncharacterized protein n=1 Tax=Ameca splendens TaxID=208324 RepID=A0ABV0Z4S9_9TELE